MKTHEALAMMALHAISNGNKNLGLHLWSEAKAKYLEGLK